MAIAPIQNPGGTTPAAASRPAKPAEPAAPAAAPLPGQPRPEQVRDAVQQLRQVVAPVARSLQFSVDDATGKTVVRVVDAATQEVIRQMPSEEVLAVARALDRLQGLLLKGKA
ncbi:MAG: hypothetical protein DPW12_12070 [Rhodocyclaceae bacterium]|nr:hypothetical protein [Rhodocyclaceae bacterium]HNQ58761.1 flagellar protein FlaG [Candidatus Desulfobacillus denitrificans]